MSIDAIQNALIDMIADKLGVESGSISVDSSIVEEIVLDSIDVVNFMFSVEEKYPGFDFEDEQNSGITTVRDLAAVIYKSV